MRYLFIPLLFVITVPLFSQEVPDTTPDTSAVVQEESEDTTQAVIPGEAESDTAVAVPPTLEYGYKGFPWGESRDRLEHYVRVDSFEIGDRENLARFHGILGEDTVTFTYSFSDTGFWKVTVDYRYGGRELDHYLDSFSRIEKLITRRYGPPRRTTQNEMGTDREYLFSDFPKLSRAYFRSSWQVELVRIELLLNAIVPKPEEEPPVFDDVTPILRLYYYHPGFYKKVESEEAEIPEETLLNVY